MDRLKTISIAIKELEKLMAIMPRNATPNEVFDTQHTLNVLKRLKEQWTIQNTQH